MAVFAAPGCKAFSMRILVAALAARAGLAILRRMTLSAIFRIVLAAQLEARRIVIERCVFKRSRRRVTIAAGTLLKDPAMRALVAIGTGARPILANRHLAAPVAFDAGDRGMFALERHAAHLAVVEGHFRGTHAAFDPRHMTVGTTVAQLFVGELMRVTVARGTTAAQARE